MHQATAEPIPGAPIGGGPVGPQLDTSRLPNQAVLFLAVAALVVEALSDNGCGPNWVTCCSR